MSGAIKLDQYIKSTGLKVNNTQKLISYYRELYQLYTDAGLPDSKYIYFLEENLYTTPFTTIPPEVYDFMSLKQDEINLLTSYVRVYKKFISADGQSRILEFPFENKTDFRSFLDPQRYMNNDFPFATTRFLGPVAEFGDITIKFVGAGGKGATVGSEYNIEVGFSMELQDPKLLFKNWTDKDNELQYKDLFAQSFGSKSKYNIVIEVGYNPPPENPTVDYSKIRNISKRKVILNLSPNAARATYEFKENGGMKLQTTLFGSFEEVSNIVNVLDNKYYSVLKKKNNMPTLDETFTTSISDFYKLEENVPALKKEVNKETKKNPPKVNKKKKTKTKTQEQIDRDRRLLQLSNNVKAIPSVFPFIAALYEAGLIYYFEIDDKVYKDYINKIADGIPIDASDVKIIPSKKDKLRIKPDDLLTKNTSSETNATTLKIKKLKDLKKDKSNTAAEKVKFFYFGDLIEVMLNNQAGTGVGQDLDSFGKEEFKFLFGQIMWVKNSSTKILYNILSTPISLDMFLHELNLEIFTKNKKHMSLQYFFSDFMKRFFDIVINSAEKTKTGAEQQLYSGENVLAFDTLKFLINQETDSNKGKFKKKLYNMLPSYETSDVTSVRLITTFPMTSGMAKSTVKKRNIPTIYVGGADKGPVGNVKIAMISLPGYAEAAAKAEAIKQLNVNTKDSIGELSESSIMITSRARIDFDLIGNSFLGLGDTVFLDTRFVDGGYFQEKENKIFLTAFYKIDKVSHTIRSGRWVTNYSAHFSKTDTDGQNTFNAAAGVIPIDQNSDIATEANKNQSNAISTPSPGTVNKPAKTQGPATKPPATPKQTPIQGDLPVVVPKTNSQSIA